MSNKVDERTTRIRFDNAQFERGVSTSMQSLDRLKNKLESTESVTAFSGIQKSADNVNFNGLISAINGVSDKFSALRMMAINVLSDIVSSAVNAGISFTKALSVDNIAAGWQKYDEEVQAVQTIMVTLEDTPIENVEQALQKISWFSDETSYSYNEMTSAMAKFISAGTGLDEARRSVIGVANAAAAAGVSTKTASRAFYNFSQAMGAGYMSLLDWKSIENINMATPEFKQNILKTAVAIGKIVQVGDDLYATQENLNKQENWFSSSNMALSLKDRWFDKDVMNQVFGMYSRFSDQVYNFMQSKEAMDAGIETASEAIEYLDKAGLSIDDVSHKAFIAGQEAKTFAEAIDSVKDAVSTKWKDSFKIIFGNYEEAKELFTDLANNLYDLFAASGDVRNSILKEWATVNQELYMDVFGPDDRRLWGVFNFPEAKSGRDLLIEGLWNLYYSIVNIVNAIKDAWNDVFPEITVERLYKFTAKFRGITKNILQYTKDLSGFKSFLSTIFTVLNKVIGFGKSAYNVIIKFIPLISKLWNLLKNIGGLIGDIGTIIFDSLKKNVNVGEIVDVIGNVIDGISEWVGKLRGKDFSGLKTILSTIFSIISRAVSIGKVLYGFGVKLVPIVSKLWIFLEKIGFALLEFGKSIFEFIENNIDTDKVIGNVNSAIETLSGWLDYLNGLDISIPAFDTLISKGSIINTIFGSIRDAVVTAFNYLKNKFANKDTAENIETVSDSLSLFGEKANTIGYYVGYALGNITDVLLEFFAFLSVMLGKILEIVGAVLDWVTEKLRNMSIGDILKIFILGGIAKFIIGLARSVKNLFDIVGSFADILDSISSVLYAKAWDLRAKAVRSIASAILIIAGALFIISKIPKEDILRSAMVMAGIIAALIGIYFVLERIDKISSKDKKFRTIFRNRGFLGLSLAVLAMVGAIALISSLLSKEGMTAGKLWSIMGIILVISLVLSAITVLVTQFSGNKRLGLSSFYPLVLALSILLMVRAFKKIDELEIEHVGKLILTIIGILVTLAAFAGIMKLISVKASVGMLLFAVTFSLILRSIEKVSTMSFELNKHSITILATAAVLMLIVAAFFAVLSFISKTKLDGSGAKILAVSTSILLIAISFIAIASAFKKLSSIGNEQIVLSGLVLLGILGVMAAVLKSAKKMSFTAPLALVGLAILSLCLSVLLGSISSLAKENIANMLASALSLVVVVGVMVGLIAVVSRVNAKASAGILALTAFALGLSVLIVTIKSLSKEDPKNVYSAIGAISLMLVALLSMYYILGKIKSSAIKAIPAILAITLTSALLGAVLVIFSALVDDAKKSIELAAAISILGVSLSIVLGILTVISKLFDFKSIIVGVVGLTLVAGVLGSFLYLVSQTVANNNIRWIKEYGSELAALAGILTIITLVTSLIGLISIVPILSGIAGLALVAGVLSGFIILLSKTVDGNNLQWLKEYGTELAYLAVIIMAIELVASIIGLIGIIPILTGIAGILLIILAIELVIAELYGIISWIKAKGKFDVFVDTMYDLIEIANIIGSVISAFITGLVFGGLPMIGEALSSFMENLEGFIRGAKDIPENFANKCLQLIEGITVLAGGAVAFNALNAAYQGPKFLGRGTLFGDFTKTLADGVGDLAIFLNTLGSINNSDVVDRIVPMLDSLGPAITSFNDAKTGNIKTICKRIGSISETIVAFCSTIVDNEDGIGILEIENALNITSRFSNVIKNLVSSTNTDSTYEFIEALETLANTGIQTFVNAFNSEKSYLELETSVSNMIKAFTNYILQYTSNSDTIKSIELSFTTILNAVLTSVESTYTKLYLAGQNVVSNFDRGLKSKISSVIATSSGISKIIYKTVDAGLGISSPSEKAIETGEYYNEGLVEGLKNTANRVKEEAGNVVSGITDTMGSLSLESITDPLKKDFQLTDWQTLFTTVGANLDPVVGASDIFDEESINDYINKLEKELSEMTSDASFTGDITPVITDDSDLANWSDLLNNNSLGATLKYSDTDIPELTQAIIRLEDKVAILSDALKNQRVDHTGEIQVRYTNESDFVDHIQTMIINNIRREVRG